MSTENTTRRVAAITGASSGIGEATARALAADGHRVALRRRDALTPTREPATSRSSLRMRATCEQLARAVCLATIDVLEGTMRDARQSQTQQELDCGTPERSDVQLAQERSLRLRATPEKQPPFDA